MSGGSLNYLYSHAFTSDVSELSQMIDELEERGFRDVADDSKAFLISHEPEDALRDVWKAIEWYVSGDWSETEVIDAITRYRAWKEAEKEKR
jgi:hypothetical protein